MSTDSTRGRRRILGLLHPLLYAVPASIAIALYATHIALIEEAELARYAAIVLLFVSAVVYGQVLLHRIIMGVAGYARNNIAVTLPLSLAVQALLFGILIQWRNTKVFHPILHHLPALLIATVVILLMASFGSIWMARRMGVRLRTRAAIRVETTLAVLAIAAVATAMYFPKPATNEKNVVVLSVDSWRYDHRNSMMPELTTPNVTSLENVGYVYENFNTHAPYTWTSLSSIMTSLESPFHGVRINGQQLKDENVTLAETLRDHGYQCFVATDIDVDLMGLTQGFEPHLRLRELGLFGFYGFNMIMAQAFPRFFQEHGFGSNNSMPTTIQGLEFVRRARGQKFFMWLHYYDEPHIPYVAPRYYVDMYNGDKRSWVTDDPGIVYALRGKPKYLKKIEGKTFTDTDYDMIRGFYKAEVSTMDRQLGMVLSSLKKNGLFDNTVIALTADHGENFGERDQWTHGSNLYRELLHVPLVIKLAGQTEGQHVPGLVRGIDIAPSILGQVAVDVPDRFHGRDIVPGSAAAASDTSGANWSFAESLAYGLGWPYKMYGFSYTSERYKYIVLPLEEQEELYDLEADPDETTNIAASRPDVVDAIHQDLNARFDIEDIFGLVPLTDRLTIGEKQMKMLRALGYVD
jgi:arylsulfatase A-like enzyme